MARLLLIEDNELFRTAWEMALSDHEVHAFDGEASLRDHLTKDSVLPYQWALIDFQLNGESDGVQLAQHLVQTGRVQATIIITSDPAAVRRTYGSSVPHIHSVLDKGDQAIERVLALVT